MAQAKLTTYPVATIAKLLDLTPRRIRQLVDEGVIPREERGRYALVPAVRGYVQYLRERAVNADVGQDELGQYRVRKLKAEAELAEMKSAETRGELVRAEDYTSMMVASFSRVRTRLLAVPSTIAPHLLGLDAAKDAQRIVKDAIYEALRELAATGREPKDEGG